MKNNYLLLFGLLVFSFLFSCTATVEVEIPEPPPGPPSVFEITDYSTDASSVGISWSPAVSEDQGMTILYDVFLDGEQVESNISFLSANLGEMFSFTQHSGYVIAKDELGQTARANFSFTTTEKTYNQSLSINGQAELLEFTKRRFNVITGDLKLFNVEDISSMLDLTRIDGNTITILNYEGKDLSGLSNVEFTGDNVDLTIQTCPNLDDIAGIQGLRNTNNIIINDIGNVKDFDGFNILSFKNLDLSSLPELTSIEGLVNKSTVQKPSINLAGLTSLKSLDGLEQFTEFEYFQCDYTQNVDGLRNLTKVDSYFLLNLKDVSLESTRSLENFKSSRYVTISGNENITDLSFLKSLEYSQYFALYNFPNMTEIEFPENFEFPTSNLGYELTFSNLGFRNLDDFPDIDPGTLIIRFLDNKHLSDYCGLKPLVEKLEPRITIISINNLYNVAEHHILSGDCSN